MVEQDSASRRAPPRGAALSTAGRIADLAAKRPTRVLGREPETQSGETAAPDSLHRSDSSRPLDRADANPAPVPQQAATVDLQWAGRGDPRQCAIPLCERTIATLQETPAGSWSESKSQP